MTEPHLLSAAEAARRIRSGELTSEALTAACADRIAALDGRIQAWAFFDRRMALEEARRCDARRGSGFSGALDGIPVGVKDIFNTIDMPTVMGSPIWKGFTPGNDARAVFYLKKAGAFAMGKTVTAEFAVHAPGPTVNPAAPDRITGTSSSGSAAAVAAGMVPVAIGTQTAGSVIRPASYCGVYGFKPSFGLVPRTGMLKTTDSLDTVGWFGRSPEDLRLLLDVMRVRGRDYPLSEARLAEAAASGPSGDRWKIALVAHPMWAHAEGYAKDALVAFAKRLAAADIEVSQPALPEILAEAHAVHGTIYDKSIAYYFKEEYRQHTLVSREIKEMVERGNGVTQEDFLHAVDRQNEIARAADAFFSKYDVALTLSTAGEPPPVGSSEKPDSCLVWTLAGLPAANLPLLKGPAGCPVGVQAVARRFSDYKLLSFAERLCGVSPEAAVPTMERK